MSESHGLNPGTLTLPQSWQPVKEELNKKEDNQEEMNNKVNKVKVANCVNEGYEFPLKEIDYENLFRFFSDKSMVSQKRDYSTIINWWCFCKTNLEHCKKQLLWQKLQNAESIA